MDIDGPTCGGISVTDGSPSTISASCAAATSSASQRSDGDTLTFDATLAIMPDLPVAMLKSSVMARRQRSVRGPVLRWRLAPPISPSSTMNREGGLGTGTARRGSAGASPTSASRSASGRTRGEAPSSCRSPAGGTSATARLWVGLHGDDETSFQPQSRRRREQAARESIQPWHLEASATGTYLHLLLGKHAGSVATATVYWLFVTHSQ
jgi:hypothetical protein